MMVSIMKEMNLFAAAVLVSGLLAIPMISRAADAKKPKPYLLQKCVVSDEKLGEMGDPYVFTYEGREIKLCCKSCLKDFKKDSAKYVKKIEEAEKKPAK